MSKLGRYELLRPLARGGMADVYLARRRVAGVEKRLVIKRLRRDRSRDPRFLDMFVREAQLSMSLVQQNIVPVFDFGRIGDDVFLAMEHIDGKDLGSSLARERGVGMPPLLAAFVAVECCQALDHAHRRTERVMHRDVTTRNVLLSWAGEVKLADFGIAAVVGDAAGTVGTPSYMAPEQARGEECDVRIDTYALGIVLWEALIGDHVRPTTDRATTVAAAKSGALPELAANIPEALAAIIRRATAVDREARFETARDMGVALDAFVVAERTRATGLAPAQRLAEWLRERWGADRDEAASFPIPDAAAGIVTFLDDGAAGVKATRTQRSIAETAGDDLATPPTGMSVVPPPPAPPPPPPGPVAVTPASRRWVLPLVGLGLVAAGAVAAVLWLDGTGARATSDAGRDAAVALVTVDAAGALDDAEGQLDAGAADAAAEDLADAAPADAGRMRLPGDAGGRVAVKPDAGLPQAPARPITIGATPWAYFTVDDDPKQYETPMTLRLGVGAHRVTFTNPQLGVSRTVTVTVPPEGDARHVEKMN